MTGEELGSVALRGVTIVLMASALASSGAAQEPERWPVHSMERPRPPVVTPGEPVATPPPSDAIVLFDGRSLGEWQGENDRPALWKVDQDYVEVVPGTGTLETRRRFGSVQLHLEWATPAPPRGDGQERGNSGVFLMGRYEIQILDSYRNDTYPDGQAGAVYGQTPPLVNASLPPGRWQSYDIVFRRPRFHPDSSMAEPARVTVLQNGVLIQNDVALTGQTVHGREATYQAHADRLPLTLQDHGVPVRFRNIWIRELPEDR